jgi:hypothetical protein
MLPSYQERRLKTKSLKDERKQSMMKGKCNLCNLFVHVREGTKIEKLRFIKLGLHKTML